MTTPPVDGEPPADLKDAELDSGSAPKADRESDGDHDAMGIDDDDPIDATLVGGRWMVTTGPGRDPRAKTRVGRCSGIQPAT